MPSVPTQLQRPELMTRKMFRMKINPRNRINGHINAFKQNAIDNGKRIEEGNRVYYDYRHPNIVTAKGIFQGKTTRVRTQ